MSGELILDCNIRCSGVLFPLVGISSCVLLCISGSAGIKEVRKDVTSRHFEECYIYMLFTKGLFQ